MEEENIKVNNIEVSCKTLIEFSSLANILLELAKNQKEMEKRMNDQDIKINNIKKLISSGGGGGGLNNSQDKENEISNILKDDDQYNINMNFNEYNNTNLSNDLNNANTMIKESENEENGDINNNIDDYNKKEINQKKQKINEGDGEAKDIVDKSNQNISEENKTNNTKESQFQNESKDNEIKDISNNIKPLDKKLDDININLPDNTNNSDLVSKTFKKVILLEKKVSELITKAGEHAVLIKNIQNNRRSINENTKNVKNLNDSTKKLKEELDKMKEKLTDFNIFDMFKDSGDGNIDMAKGLVMALEKKINKRLDLMDEKYKVMTNDNFKTKGDLQNLSNTVNNSSTLIKKILIKLKK